MGQASHSDNIPSFRKVVTPHGILYEYRAVSYGREHRNSQSPAIPIIKPLGGVSRRIAALYYRFFQYEKFSQGYTNGNFRKLYEPSLQRPDGTVAHREVQTICIGQKKCRGGRTVHAYNDTRLRKEDRRQQTEVRGQRGKSIWERAPVRSSGPTGQA